MEDLLLVALATVAVVGIVVSTGRLVRRAVVFEHERGVLYTQGRFVRVLEPGVYWHLTHRSVIHRLDMRPRTVPVPGQEVLSADSVSLRVTLAARYVVADPYGAINNSANYQEALYSELQMALREIVGGTRIDDLLEKRQELGRRLLELAAPSAEALGLRLLSVGIKDMMFPGELKKVFAQVVKAQKDGIAALERARGETAALRNLANAAKMIESNPALLQLRLLQAIGDGSGNSVVLGLPSQATPLPIVAKPGERAEPETPRPPELPPER